MISLTCASGTQTEAGRSLWQEIKFAKGNPMDGLQPGGKTACIESLKRRILTLDLKPGENLDEVEIGSTYAISRPPVREVLRQLAGEGYALLVENRGAVVAPMSHKTLRNFFIVAPMIYAAVARLAAQHANRGDVERLKHIQTVFRAAIVSGDVTERAIQNERFHDAMGEIADNEFLLPSLRRLLIDHTRISMTFYNPDVKNLSKQQAIAADQHDQFIELIETGNADAAGDLAIAHWELSREQMERFVTPESIYIPLGAPPRSLNEVAL